MPIGWFGAFLILWALFGMIFATLDISRNNDEHPIVLIALAVIIVVCWPLFLIPSKSGRP
jgi:cell division protein FtsW (lipid II flippase)